MLSTHAKNLYVGTTVERTALGSTLSPVITGAVFFDTDLQKMYHWDGLAWNVYEPELPSEPLTPESKFLNGLRQWAEVTIDPSTIDHNSLDNLTVGDPHTQYLKEIAVSASNHYTGFPNHTDTALSWDDATATFTLTVATVASIWVDGEEYSIETLSKAFDSGQDETSGVYWFWITAPLGVPQLNYSASPSDKFGLCLVASVYWNTTTNNGILIDERHWFGRDKWMHEYLHETFGARYSYGLAGTFDDTTFTIDAGEFYDEDIEHYEDAATSAKILYHDGSSDWTWDVLSTPYKVVNPGVDNTLQYNNGNALASIGNQKFAVYWVYATGDEDDHVHIYMGSAEYNTEALAIAATQQSRDILTSPEDKLIYQIIYKNNNGTPLYVNSIDHRASAESPSGITSDHGSLAGLSDDDHPQYVLNSGDTMTGDLDFDQYKAIAMVCDQGDTFPTSPTVGQWFLYKTAIRETLYMYSAIQDIWIAVITLSDSTIYVDNTLGTDDYNYGGGTGADAYKTIMYALRQVGYIQFKSVAINLAAGAHTETLYLDAYVTFYSPNANFLTINGATSLVTSGTVSASSAGTVTEQATVTVSGAGWTVDEHIKRYVKFASGYSLILSNTADTITIVGGWESGTAPAVGTTIEIYELTTIWNNATGICIVGQNLQDIRFQFLDISSDAAPVCAINKNSFVNFFYCNLSGFSAYSGALNAYDSKIGLKACWVTNINTTTSLVTGASLFNSTLELGNSYIVSTNKTIVANSAGVRAFTNSIVKATYAANNGAFLLEGWDRGIDLLSGSVANFDTSGLAIRNWIINNNYGIYAESLGSMYGYVYNYFAGNTVDCTETLIQRAGALVFNEDGNATSDIRIEGNTDPYLLFTDASEDSVAIGRSAATAKLDIKGNTKTDEPTYSAEFLDDANWTLGAGWSGDFAAGFTHTSGGGTATLTHDHAAVINTYYTIYITITGRTTGSIGVSFGGQTRLQTTTATINWGPKATATDSLVITPTTDFNGTVVLSIVSITDVVRPTIRTRDSADNIGFEVRTHKDESNTFVGLDSGMYNSTGYYNTAFGRWTLVSNTTGYQNVAIGNAVLTSNTVGQGNIGLGYYALNKNIDGYNNTALGYNALNSNISGYNNVAIGYNALLSNLGNTNIAIGYMPMYTNTTGYNNIAVGEYALWKNTEGYYNTVIGHTTMTNCTVGRNNTVIGYNSLTAATNPRFNTIIGSQNGGNILGWGNIVIGYDSLNLCRPATNNISMGYQSLISLNPGYKAITAFEDYSGTVAGTTLVTSTAHGFTGIKNIQIYGSSYYDGTYAPATYVDANHFYIVKAFSGTDTATWSTYGEGWGNIALGRRTGYGLTNGSNNVFIGDGAGSSASQLATAGSSVAIGYNSYTTASNQISLGGTSSSMLVFPNTSIKVGIGTGTTTPASKLDVVGDNNGDSIKLTSTYDNSSLVPMGLNAVMTYVGSGNITTYSRPHRFTYEITGTGGQSSGEFSALMGQFNQKQTSDNIANGVAVHGKVSLGSTGTATILSSFYATMDNTGNGNITSYRGLFIQSPISSGSSVINSSAGIYISQMGITGKVNSAYGLYISDQTLGTTNNISIRTNAGKIMFNEGGHAEADLTSKTDNYTALFVDTSADSITIMDNTAGKLGFHGATPVVQQVLATGASHTVDDVIALLQTLGLCKQS